MFGEEDSKFSKARWGMGRQWDSDTELPEQLKTAGYPLIAASFRLPAITIV